MILLQNVLAVFVLSRAGRGGDMPGSRVWVRMLFLNPIILSIVAGMIFSLSGLSLPVVLDRSLKILGGLALPMALLLIGSSISLVRYRTRLRYVLAASVFKLILLPALGLLLYSFLGLSKNEYLPGMILLAAPPAAMVYVMSLEMKGDPDLASASISLMTLASGLTYTLWLSVL